MKEFKAESKRLLDLMINSIYTHKEIFLRELISNANDALNKRHFMSLTDSSIKADDLKIVLELDKKERTLTITDSGIGMNAKEMEDNLGTIAKSGTLAFRAENKDAKDLDVIGQFGVGFYSAFMVADKVKVISKKIGNEAYTWLSEGAEGYELTPCQKAEYGTQIVLYIKKNDKEDKYDSFLDAAEITQLVKKYSDYIKHPIVLGGETINSRVPIWKKPKKELTKEEYDNFYKNKFYDYTEPLKTLHTKAEGITSYTALLYIPKNAPYNFHTKEYEKGLQLYTNGVLIMEKCKELLPDYFGFVKGLVDTEDVSLNISREMLQSNRQLRAIAASIEKKIKSELSDMLEKDRESYEKLFKNFSMSIKYGVYENYGAKKELLCDLLMFESSFEKKYTTLKEYVSRMKEGQEAIYYGAGESMAKISQMPQTEAVIAKGYEILYLSENIDEFVLKILGKYDGKDFCSIAESNLDLASDEEKKQVEEQNKTHEEMLKAMTVALSGKVEKVKLSLKLKSHAACLSSEGELSLEMERVLKSMPNSDGLKAKRVLELNGAHPVFAKLTALYESDKAKLDKYAVILYNQSLLVEGIMIDDAVAFSDLICELM